MRFCLSLFVFAISSVAVCSDRLKVADNSGKAEFVDLIKSVAMAFEAEDLDKYEACFKESRRPTMRRQAAFMFVDGHCSMELVDMHMIEVSEESALAVVKYKMSNSSPPMEFLSEVKFLKENGSWVIDREVVKSKRQPQSASYASVPNDPVPIRQAGARWNPMNPNADLMSSNLEHLVGDIGIREGKGCSGGNCPNGRCFVK